MLSCIYRLQFFHSLISSVRNVMSAYFYICNKGGCLLVLNSV